MSKGRVYLVGAGPGEAGLLTVRACEIIGGAEVIVYDRLIPAGALELAPAPAERICVGKSAGSHPVGQDEINAILIEKARAGRMVVRLKGGDPYLLGRGGEEAESLREAGVEFEVVPGVTSALAAGCYAGMPATHRDYASSVAIVTGHRRAGGELRIPTADTIIFLMGVANIEEIVAQLQRAGWDGDSAMAAVENATYYNQRVVTGKLEEFAEKIGEAGVKPPAVVIVGTVVECGGRLDWFSRRPRILVVGTHPEKYGYLGTIVHRPVIKLVGLEDYGEVDRQVGRLGEYQWLIFTSTNAVKFFFERLGRSGRDSRALAGVKVAAIGSTTAGRLAEEGIVADIRPEDESSEGLLGEFAKRDIRGKRVLIPRSDAAGEELAAGLGEMGAKVRTVAVYRNVEVEPAEVDFAFIDYVLFTSGSTVRAFVRFFGGLPAGVGALCLGKPTLAEAEKFGISGRLLEEYCKEQGR